eukprot:5593213-Amphidinium_carterae.1
MKDETDNGHLRLQGQHSLLKLGQSLPLSCNLPSKPCYIATAPTTQTTMRVSLLAEQCGSRQMEMAHPHVAKHILSGRPIIPRWDEGRCVDE